MKRLLSIILIGILLTGCAAIPPSPRSLVLRENDGAKVVMDPDGRLTVETDTVPLSIYYNADKRIKVSDFDYYEWVLGYEYWGVAVIEVDLTELDDAEIYWLAKDKAFFPCVSVNPDRDDFETDYPRRALRAMDDEHIRTYYSMRRGAKKSLAGEKLYISVHLIRDEDKYDTYYCDYQLPDELPTDKDFPEDLEARFLELAEQKRISAIMDEARN